MKLIITGNWGGREKFRMKIQVWNFIRQQRNFMLDIRERNIT